MQIRYLASAIALTLVFSSPTFAAGKSATFKCWTNKDGIRECGNEVPPEYSQGETETINKEGFTTKVEQRAKTAAEVAEEQRKKDEAAARAAEEKRKHDEQATYDRVLMATFLTENDIVAARDRRTSAIDATIDVTKVTTAKLEEKLKTAEQKVEAQKKGNKAGNADDQKDVDALKKQLADKQAYIDAKQKEKEATITEYDAYIKRFRELKGTSSPN
jgi:hypothetical protein